MTESDDRRISERIVAETYETIVLLLIIERLSGKTFSFKPKTLGEGRDAKIDERFAMAFHLSKKRLTELLVDGTPGQIIPEAEAILNDLRETRLPKVLKQCGTLARHLSDQLGVPEKSQFGKLAAFLPIDAEAQLIIADPEDGLRELAPPKRLIENASAIQERLTQNLSAHERMILAEIAAESPRQRTSG
jgi:hypothetical protein